MSPFKFLPLLLFCVMAQGALPEAMWREGVPVSEIRESLHRPGLDPEDQVRLRLLLMKRLYENKAGMMDMLSSVSTTKAAVEALAAARPDDGRTHCLKAEMLQYVPGFLGGSLDRADELFGKALALSPDSETRYKAALFHLNSRYLGEKKTASLDRAEELLRQIHRLPKPEGADGPRALVWRWTPYQLAVIAMVRGNTNEALALVALHREHCPESIWGPYLAWTLTRFGNPSKSVWGSPAEALATCRKLARDQGDRVMLDRLAKEEK